MNRRTTTILILLLHLVRCYTTPLIHWLTNRYSTPNTGNESPRRDWLKTGFSHKIWYLTYYCKNSSKVQSWGFSDYKPFPSEDLLELHILYYLTEIVGFEWSLFILKETYPIQRDSSGPVEMDTDVQGIWDLFPLMDVMTLLGTKKIHRGVKRGGGVLYELVVFEVTV